LWITDGGLETTLVFLHGVDLPHFAAFPLLDSDEGRAHLADYFKPYFDAAVQLATPIVVDTPTWRANLDWGTRLGYDAASLAALNRRAVRFVADLVAARDGLVAAINGVIGPRGDGYVATELMTADEAAHYHALQARAFADAEADMLSAVTMTYAAEAIGIARAAAAVGLRHVISFTVETDGRLPSGQPLGDAIAEVDAATDGSVAYFMVNCAHPSHFEHVLDRDASWTARIGGVRANASAMSHAELDEAPTLDRGDPARLAEDHLRLRGLLPQLSVVGGCCGTDHEHVTAIASAVATAA
jgi:S-methylmethionine-dependent homocysteine/selenocysteine methylase